MGWGGGWGRTTPLIEEEKRHRTAIEAFFQGRSISVTYEGECLMTPEGKEERVELMKRSEREESGNTERGEKGERGRLGLQGGRWE